MVLRHGIEMSVVVVVGSGVVLGIIDGRAVGCDSSCLRKATLALSFPADKAVFLFPIVTGADRIRRRAPRAGARLGMEG